MMQTFYTKTISSILGPVAEKVSLLVILHEEAEAGIIISDVNKPITAVVNAVINLADIGADTYQSSYDELLKKEMPIALKRIKTASQNLEQAAYILETDQTSSLGRSKIIDGSRSILQGTSAVLLAYDMSEVRIIINKCNEVKLFMNEIETVQNFVDLTNFIKNLAPLLTTMTKMTLARAGELTVQAHADMLIQSVQQITQCTALLLSSLKLLIIASDCSNNFNESSVTECKMNRNKSTLKFLVYIQEIIRVLQLTGDHESTWWDGRQCIVTRHCKTIIDSRSGLIDKWLFGYQNLDHSVNNAATEDLIHTLTIMSNNCTDDTLRNDIVDNITHLKLLFDEISDLRERDEDSSEMALNLIHQFRGQYATVLTNCDVMMSKMPNMSIVKMPKSVDDRLALALSWLSNLNEMDRISGVAACNSLVEDARHTIGALQKFSKNHKLVELLTEISSSITSKTNQLNDHLIHNKGVVSDDGLELSGDLYRDVTLITQHMSAAIVDQVSENFVDLKCSIQRISKTSYTAKNDLNRLKNFADAKTELLEHSSAMCGTADLVLSLAYESQPTKTLNLLADEIDHLSAQVTSAGYMVLMNNGDTGPQLIVNHFEILKHDWQNKVEMLRNEVDKFVDSFALVSIQENAIALESDKMENSIRIHSLPGIVDSTTMIAHRGNRIVHKAEIELSQNEDPLYVDHLVTTITQLRHSITSMATAARNMMTNLNDQDAIIEWRAQNNTLRDAVNAVKDAVVPTTATCPPDSTENGSLSSTDSPKFNDVEDRFDFPAASPNQPILAAAHVLHRETRQWSSKNNDIIAAAKRMANLMAKLSQLVRDENGSKRDLIGVSKDIVRASEDVTKCARQLGEQCTDTRIKNNLLQVCDKIPTIGTQLGILSTVKATTLGTGKKWNGISKASTIKNALGSEEDGAATEMLVGNAQNLMQSVVDTVHAAEAASIKLRIDSGYTIRWCKKTE